MGFLWDLAKDLPVSAALAERIKMADAEIKNLTKENAEFKKKNTELQAENTEIRNELLAKAMVADEFIDFAGLKFRRLNDGSYDKTIPYCPKCHTALYIESVAGRRNHKCSNCGFIAPLTVRQLNFQMQSL